MDCINLFQHFFSLHQHLKPCTEGGKRLPPTGRYRWYTRDGETLTSKTYLCLYVLNLHYAASCNHSIIWVLSLSPIPSQLSSSLRQVLRVYKFTYGSRLRSRTRAGITMLSCSSESGSAFFAPYIRLHPPLDYGRCFCHRRLPHGPQCP